MICCLVNNLGCVQLANLDKLDFEIRISDFAIRKQISSSKNLTVLLRNPKNCSREQCSANYVCACETAVLANSFSNSFWDFAFYCTSEIRILKTKSKFPDLSKPLRGVGGRWSLHLIFLVLLSQLK